MAKISVAMCCANVGDTLEAACQSVAWADELIIVDSGSTDATAEIARRYAQRYVVEPWRGFTKQKQFAAALARNPWVLVLDGDEECSPELAKELQALTEAGLERYDVLMMRRRNHMLGRVVRAWWPDWQSRLIHRDRTIWAEEALHDRRLPSDPKRLGRLRGWIEHRRTSAAGFLDYFNGELWDQRLPLTAKELYDKGKRCTWRDIVLRPPLTFFKFYVLKRGFLDGSFGYLIAQKAAVGVQLKYAALWAHQQGVALKGKQRTPR